MDLCDSPLPLPRLALIEIKKTMDTVGSDGKCTQCPYVNDHRIVTAQSSHNAKQLYTDPFVTHGEELWDRWFLFLGASILLRRAKWHTTKKKPLEGSSDQ